MLNEIFDVILDAIVDSAKMLPIIFVCYMLIELLEEKILVKYKSSNLLKNKFAPVASAGFGLIPQCGFSVVATDLFSKKVITLGSLLAIFIATSDEAVPLLLTRPDQYPNLFLILGIKFVYAVAVGLLVDMIYRRLKSKRGNSPVASQNMSVANVKSKTGENIDCCNKEDSEKCEDADHEEVEIHGCCHHELEKNHSKWKEILFHPLLHSIKIFAFVLIMNIIIGLLVLFVGEGSIQNFMMSAGVFQPFLVALAGMIPNCAVSIAITDLFMGGLISLGSCIAGLCVNCGIATVVLFKLNKDVKQNLLIVGLLFALGSLLGFVINLF
ncbi:MAG: putative manganese transporter [Christensenellales bacterium]